MFCILTSNLNLIQYVDQVFMGVAIGAIIGAYTNFLAILQFLTFGRSRIRLYHEDLACQWLH